MEAESKPTKNTPSIEHDDFSIEKFRFSETFKTLPPTTGKILEIGFNDLRMTRLLAERYQEVYGIDLRKLENQRKNKKNIHLTYASIDHLPFGDETFDLVVCAQVLEHLPNEVLDRGVKELARVSKKWIFVSVPYQQRVWNELHKCAHCGFIVNSMAHLHYFDEENLLPLFPGWTVKEARKIGELKGYAPDNLYKLANRWGNSWSKLHWNCPKCGKKTEEQQENIFGYLLRRVIWRLENLAPKRKGWILLLLERDR